MSNVLAPTEPELSSLLREKVGEALFRIGTSAVQGEILTEKVDVTKDELRRVVQSIMDRTHMLQQFLQ